MKTTEVLQNLIELFKSDKIPEAIAIATFPSFDVPANHWSLLNRLLLYFSGTRDARGYRQWESAGRHVKKGAKAIYILAPSVRKREKPEKKKADPEEGKPEEGTPAGNSRRSASPGPITSFISVPVFPAEATDGEPLDYQKLPVPQVPLMGLADKWELSIKAVPGNNIFLGSYSPAKQTIELATDEEKVFFHELAHHAHKLIMGNLKAGQDWRQEIVAELSSQALCRLVGKGAKDTLGNSYQYIAHYARDAGLSPVAGCLAVISDVEQVVNLILKESPRDFIQSCPGMNKQDLAGNTHGILQQGGRQIQSNL